MSLLPFILGAAPRHHAGQDFGVITPDDFLTDVVAPMVVREYYRPLRQMGVATSRDVGSTVVLNKEKFQVNLDVQHFAPEEISVKTSDGYVIIEGKHEEKKDEHGYVSRQFTRRYILPENCDPATVESRLSSDGVLTVIAPKVSPTAKNERSVPISQTGPVRKDIKDAASQQTPQGDANNGTVK